MYDLTIPTFTYAGALVPVAKPANKLHIVALAICAGLLLAALAI